MQNTSDRKMSDRKAELEKKKAKLQAIREEKERRRREKEQRDAEEAALRAPNPDKDQKKVDEMLSSLGIAPVSDVLSSLSSVPTIGSSDVSSSTATPDSSLLQTQPQTGRKKPAQLQVVSVQSTSIPPKETVTYTKQTQTTHTSNERDAEDDSLPSLLDGGGGFGSKLPPGILPHGLPKVKEMEPAVTTVEPETKKDVKTIRELSEDEKMMIILSEDFQRFVDRTGRIMERALSEAVDICTDYTGTADADDVGDERLNGKLVVSRWFSDERWSKTRCVTSLDWSPQYPELLVASYHTSHESAHDPDGVCLVWNTKFKKTTPEYVFHCQSIVLTATFAKFHPNLILGGTYSGQVMLWDNRVQKRTPIQRTPLSATAHTHPVYCMRVVGTQNAHNLISISTDGRLCSWSLDMLSQPQETLELQQRQSKAIAVTSLDFPHNDVNNFVFGSEEGTVYSACRHGTKAGVTDPYLGHQAPVTDINTHKVQGPVDYSHLFLTSSFDWSVKLWNMKESRPVYSWEEGCDYVYGVCWSPVHPAVFASVDGDGRLALWNLNQDAEIPSASTVVEGAPALNRVSFTPTGSHVTVGDDSGKIYLYDVGERFSQPRHDEWNKLLVTLQEMKNNQADEEVSSPASGPSSLSSFVSR
ncbi:cytoplasmic dynein 1 intermediate chain isoform X20 [Halyomorpha halys]|uniref:cytoplasmic dynein 1 intermediate chain isoform X20 n=1 Tax=Halyomorpha halys TaxID=286706 RepID=UPI0006D51AF7|nr:cytoplasmic dynein 1 intermediate chain isoform X24 [Halyomorpha halys]